jgi:AAHS family benzoate transporter-like MFS transporter
MIAIGFTSAAAALLTMAATPAPAVLAACVVIAGFGGMGTQNIINDYVAQFYPVGMRATGLGWALAVGRLGAIAGPSYGALMVVSGGGVGVAAIGFAVPAVLGAAVILFLPRRNALLQDRRESADQTLVH